MKRIFLALLLLLSPFSIEAATVTWSAAADGAASVGGNWSNGTGISAGDDVVFDGTSVKNCTWDITTNLKTFSATSAYTETITCTAAFNCTTTTGSFTFDATGTFDSNGQTVTVTSIDASGTATKTITCGASVWTVGGSCNLSGTNLTFTKGTSEFRITSTGTITTAGTVEFYKLSHAAPTCTITLASDVSVVNTLDLNTTANANTWNGNMLLASGDVIKSGSGQAWGTTVLKFTGGSNQDWSQATATNAYTNTMPVQINKSANTLTLSGTLRLDCNLTHIAGTVVTTGSTVVYGGDATITSNGSIEWDNLSLKAGTFTLADNLTVNGTLDLAIQGEPVINGSTIYAKGNVIKTVATGYSRVDGTTILEFSGNAAQAWSQTDGSSLYTWTGLPVIINKSGNTLTISGDLNLAGNFTYTAGTVSTTGSTIYRRGSVNHNSGILAWNNFQISAHYGATTITLTGNLNIDGNLTIDASQILSVGSNTINCAGNWTKTGTFTAGTSTVIFDGTSTVAGATAFYNLTLTGTTHLTSTQTFSTNAAGTFTATNCTLDATTPTSRALLNVAGTQSVSTVTATDIDSSGGNEVINTGGTISNTVNWSVPAVPAYAMVKTLIL